MINEKGLIGGVVGSAISGVGATISLEQLDRIISIVCSVFGVIITIICVIVIPLVRWYKEAKKDGKITKEEIKEGVDIAKNGIESVKGTLDNKNKKED